MGLTRWIYAAAALMIVFVWLLVLPPRWWLNYTKPVDLSDPVSAGAAIVEKYDCRQCHLIDKRGTSKGPSLSGVTTRLDSVSLRLWLMNPRAVRWGTTMPNFHLSDGEIDAIAAYLTALDRSNNPVPKKGIRH